MNSKALWALHYLHLFLSLQSNCCKLGCRCISTTWLSYILDNTWPCLVAGHDAHNISAWFLHSLPIDNTHHYDSVGCVFSLWTILHTLHAYIEYYLLSIHHPLLTSALRAAVGLPRPVAGPFHLLNLACTLPSMYFVLDRTCILVMLLCMDA